MSFVLLKLKFIFGLILISLIYLFFSKLVVEGFDVVNMSINVPVSCNNFCGPKATCAITGEQCSTDVDCQGCQHKKQERNKCETSKLYSYNDVTLPNEGRHSFYQGFQYDSPLINDFATDFAQAYPNSNKSTVTLPYQGLDTWSQSFNEGLDLYNKKRGKIASYYEPKYPLTVSATGMFYETTPPPANASYII